MARLARELADAGVNVHGHLFLGRWSDRATFAFVVDDPEKARPDPRAALSRATLANDGR